MLAVSKSNHDVVTCQIITHGCAARNGGVYKSINYDALQLQLSTIEWRALMANTVDVGDLWKIFHDFLNTVIHNCTQITLPRSVYVLRRLRILFLRKKRRWKIWKSQPAETKNFAIRWRRKNLLQQYVNIDQEKKISYSVSLYHDSIAIFRIS